MASSKCLEELSSMWTNPSSAGFVEMLSLTMSRMMQADLAKVDRKKTPWLVAVLHAPWYNSNVAHQGEGAAMMAVLEPVLYSAKVDIMFAGHVHAYERFVSASAAWRQLIRLKCVVHVLTCFMCKPSDKGLRRKIRSAGNDPDSDR